MTRQTEFFAGSWSRRQCSRLSPPLVYLPESGHRVRQLPIVRPLSWNNVIPTLLLTAVPHIPSSSYESGTSEAGSREEERSESSMIRKYGGDGHGGLVGHHLRSANQG